MKPDWSALRSPRAVVAMGILVLVATVVSGRDKPGEEEVVAPTQRSEPRAPSEEPFASLDLERLRRPAKKGIGNDVFAPNQPQAPQASPAPGPRGAAPPPAVPEAPPLPFRYLGQMVDGGRKLVFLARDNAHYTVQAGQAIGDEYRVEEIASNEITLTWLPAGIRQSLAIPALD